MRSDKPAGVRRADKWSVKMEGSGDNEEPNLACDKSVPENCVLRKNLLFGDCNEFFESAWNSRPGGHTSFAVYSPAHSEDPRGQIMTRTRSNDLPCLPGRSSGQTTSGAALEGSNGDGDDAAAEMKTGKNEKKKKRAVRGIRGGRPGFKMVWHGPDYAGHCGYKLASLPKGKGADTAREYRDRLDM